MNHDRFEQLLGAYGADLRRWPAHERAAGHALLREQAPALQAAHAEAAALDALLMQETVAPASDALAERLAALAPVKPVAGRVRARAPASASGGWLIGWPGVAGLGLAGVAGAWAGAMAVSVALGLQAGAMQDAWLDNIDAFGAQQSHPWSEE